MDRKLAAVTLVLCVGLLVLAVGVFTPHSRAVTVSVRSRGLAFPAGEAPLESGPPGSESPPAVAGSVRGRIAFARSSPDPRGVDSYDLYLMDADGGNAHRVAQGLVDPAGGPAWAPGGGRLVFGREGSRSEGGGRSGPGLWMVDVDGGGETRLTDGSLHREFAPRVPREFHPSFSPDGRRVVFVRSYGDGVEGLPQRVVIVDTETLREREVPLSGTKASPANLVNCFDPCWSPDGRTLGFVEDGWSEAGDLWTTTPNGAKPVLPACAPGQGEQGTYPPDDASSRGRTREMRYPSWSPDGTRIAFAAGGLYVMDARGEHRRLVREWRVPQVSELAWAPDGRHIAVVLNAYGSGSIEVVDVETGQSVSAPGGTYADSVSWSPDGQRLVFASFGSPLEMVGSPTARCVICRVNTDGTGSTVLTPEGVHDASPAWEPGK